MMKLFFKDHLIWFLLLFVLFLWMNLLFVLDTGLQTVSVIYLNGTSLFIVVVVVSIYALWWRKQLKNRPFLLIMLLLLWDFMKKNMSGYV